MSLIWSIEKPVNLEMIFSSIPSVKPFFTISSLASAFPSKYIVSNPSPYFSIIRWTSGFLVCVFNTIDNLLDCVILIWAKHHQRLLTLVKDDIFADNLAKRTLVKEEVGKHIEVVECIITLVSPIECELVSAIRIIGKVAGIDTVRNYKYLNVVKQAVKRCLVVSLDLVVCLLQLHASLL